MSPASLGLQNVRQGWLRLANNLYLQCVHYSFSHCCSCCWDLPLNFTTFRLNHFIHCPWRLNHGDRDGRGAGYPLLYGRMWKGYYILIAFRKFIKPLHSVFIYFMKSSLLSWMLRGVRRFCSIYWTWTITEISTRKSLSGLDHDEHYDNEDKNAISCLDHDQWSLNNDSKFFVSGAA